MKKIVLALLSVLFVNIVNAQIKPSNGAVLNYRLGGFTTEKHLNAKKYVIEVIVDSAEDEHDFERHPKQIYSTTTGKTAMQLPSFGTKYTWRYTCYDKADKMLFKSPMYHFRTAAINIPDTGLGSVRIRVINNLFDNDTSLYFFSDNIKSLINIKGEVLWQFPESSEFSGGNISIRDMKITPQGTITFITGVKIYEIDYDGKVLWEGPNTGEVGLDTIEYYHHEFTRLPNGHYMVLGQYNELRKLNNIADTALFPNANHYINKGDGIYYRLAPFGSIIEYDTNGKVVWSCKTGNYFKEEDIFISGSKVRMPGNTHMNAFFFDTKNNVIYISFRDINKILKIKYPSGELLASYGAALPSEDKNVTGDGLFFGQHSCRINKAGNLYLFNNNKSVHNAPRGSATEYIAQVLVLKEPKLPNDKLQVMWKFDCDIDDNAKSSTGGGGSVYELDGGGYLVCMGTTNRVFITTNTKKILWNAVFELKDWQGNWQPFGGYRVSPVYRDQLINKLVLQ